MNRPSVIFTALIAIALSAGRTAAASTCASQANLAFPDTTITAAESVPAGTYTAPDGEVFKNMPAFCRVAATMTPTSDSNIKVEVWMRYSGWNGRYLGLGNGGIGRRYSLQRFGGSSSVRRCRRQHRHGHVAGGDRSPRRSPVEQPASGTQVFERPP